MVEDELSAFVKLFYVHIFWEVVHEFMCHFRILSSLIRSYCFEAVLEYNIHVRHVC